MCILWVLSLVNPAQYTLWVQSLVLRWEYPRSYFFPPPTSFSHTHRRKWGVGWGERETSGKKKLTVLLEYNCITMYC